MLNPVHDIQDAMRNFERLAPFNLKFHKISSHMPLKKVDLQEKCHFGARGLLPCNNAFFCCKS